MRAHTEGPWEVKVWRGRYTVTAVDGVICAISKWTPEIDEADACLIAAAPDLLAILKDMRNAPDPYDWVGGWWEEIDAAIAKAEGRL